MWVCEWWGDHLASGVLGQGDGVDVKEVIGE